MLSTIDETSTVPTESIPTQVKRSRKTGSNTDGRKPSTDKSQLTDADKKLSAITSTVNFLNSYYKANTPEDKRRITFKVYDDKRDKDKFVAAAKKNTPSLIDVREYAGVRQLTDRIDDLRKHHRELDIRRDALRKELKDPITPEKDIQRIKDEINECSHLSAFNEARKVVTEPYMFAFTNHAFHFGGRDSNEEFMNDVIAEVGLVGPRLLTPIDYIDKINEFLTSDTKINTKLYNATFNLPHREHAGDGASTGVDTVYLQRLSNHHNIILEMLANGKTEFDILHFISKDIADNLQLPAKTETDRTRREYIRTQLVSPEILDHIINPTRVVKNGKDVPDMSWVNGLHKIDRYRNGKKLRINDAIITDEPLDKDVLKYVRNLITELGLAHKTIQIVTSANDHDAISESWEKYVEKQKIIRDFVKSHEGILSVADGMFPLSDDEKSAGRIHSVNAERFAFTKYFIETVCFLKTVFGYTSPLKNFLSDLRPLLVLKFGRELRREIEDAIAKWDKSFGNRTLSTMSVNISADTIKSIILDHEIEVESGKKKLIRHEFDGLNIAVQHRSTETKVYGNLGKYACLDTKASENVGIGMAIMKWLIDHINIEFARNQKKKDVTVYIRG